MPIRHVAVIDIGKTNAKVALVDLDSLAEIAVRRTPNHILSDGPYPHHDVERLWDFILESLATLNSDEQADAISVTTHGATAALVGRDGRLAMPVLDYEHDGPDRVHRDYDAARPPFLESGTPRLPFGLNLAAQLFWQQRAFPDAFAGVEHILLYPQYWSFRLTGIAASEVTSLGCHTDLWNPAAANFSTLVDRMGWRRLMAPLRPTADRLGTILPEIARRTGLDADTPVFCGIHDSNASLLPHLMTRRQPFAVVSTGTWVVAMAMGGTIDRLDPDRDTLVNVNALGNPVPSARFMGGREYQMLIEGFSENWSERDVDRVLDKGIMLLPAVQHGSGPFPGRKAEWVGAPDPAERQVAASFYLAMMTAACLDLVGADGTIVVEGPFARNVLFLRMLSAASGRGVIAGGDATGTSIGAALLALDKPLRHERRDNRVLVRSRNWQAYADAWIAAVKA